MARAQLPAVIDAISGTTGGLIFSIGPAGTMIVGRAPTPGTRTTKQTAAAAAFTAMMRVWASAVTPAQKASWKTFGATHPTPTRCGSTANLPGCQAFLRSAQALATLHLPPLTTPPGSWGNTAPGTATLTAQATGTALLRVSTANRPANGEHPVIWASGPRFSGRGIATSSVAIVYIGTNRQRGPYEIAAPYQQKFGALKVGQSITVQVRFYDSATGWRSDPSTAQAIAT